MGSEPTTPAGERLQTYALDRAATGTGDSVAEMSFTYTRHFTSRILQTDTHCSIECYSDLIKAK